MINVFKPRAFGGKMDIESAIFVKGCQTSLQEIGENVQSSKLWQIVGHVELVRSNSEKNQHVLNL